MKETNRIRRVVLIGMLAWLTATSACSSEIAIAGGGRDGGFDSSMQLIREDECGNGMDDDADGRIDDGCPCGSGEVQWCFSETSGIRGVGICRDGVQRCRAEGLEWGDWGASICEGGVKPASSESCDGLDHDCDGAIDEGCPCAAFEMRECGVSDRAPCRKGTQTCLDTGIWSGCEGAISPSRDVCGDGIDNDCDGAIDVGCSCTPRPEECRDGLDNDCDGVIDEPACRPDWSGECIGCGPCVSGDDLTAFERTLIEMAPRTWLQAPNSHMRDVCVTDPGINCRNILTQSGGAYDSNARRMLIWGGGGNAYWGNELYAFDLRNGTWSRLTEPSRVPAGMRASEFFNRDPLSDAQPVARSTFDCLEFLPDSNELWTQGGSRAIDGAGTGVTWFFNSASGWVSRSPGPGGYSIACAYDTASRRVFVHQTEGFWIYDVANDIWTENTDWRFPPLWPRYSLPYNRTAVIDPRRRLLWSVGGQCPTPSGECHGMVMVWDTMRSMPVTDEWRTIGAGAYTNRESVERFYPDQIFESGGGAIYYASAPGIDYDSAADDLVAWPNRGAPYALDLETKEWVIGGGVGAPDLSTGTFGTFGRWRYVPEYNVFILVNSVDENVYFYKHTSGCGPD